MTCVVGRLGFVVAAALAVVGTPVSARAQGLQERVAALEEEVNRLDQILLRHASRIAALEDTLRDAFQHQTITVNCANGSVNAALAAVAGFSAPVTIQVRGICVEAVNVTRDDVQIRGDSWADGIRAPSGGTPLQAVGGQRVSAHTLTLEGGLGLAAVGGASLSADNVHVINSQTGLNVTFDAHLNVRNSLIENNASGALVGRTGFLTLRETTIRNNSSGITVIGGNVLAQIGLVLENNGRVGLQATSSRINVGDAVIRGHEFGVLLESSTFTVGGTIADNTVAGVAMTNGSSAALSGTIEHNGGRGVDAMGGSAVMLRNATIRNNTSDGVWLMDVSVVARDTGTSLTITANGGTGLNCAPPPTVAQITNLSINSTHVFGNTAGQINCPGAGTP